MRERPLQAGPPSAAAATGTPPSLVPQPGASAAPAPPAAAPADAERPAVRPVVDRRARRGRTRRGFAPTNSAPRNGPSTICRRIDATVAALKAAGVPVFWVGLPSIRGPKSTSEMLYLNDLYRTRAEKAGVTYIDVWDGFVDESGRFAVQGPDFEGQIRRLRVSDGVHFTKSGARKLAHYLEREVRRMMQRGTDLVALPAEPQAPQPSGAAGRRDRASAVRSGGAAHRFGQRQPGTAGRRRFQRQRQSARRDARAGQGRVARSAGRPQRRLPLAAPRRRGLRHRSGGRHHHRSGAGRSRARTGDRHGDACRCDPKAASTLTPGTRKTTGRSQPGQAQQQARPPQRQAQPRRDSFGGGGFGGFGR